MTQPIYLRLCTETANDLPMIVTERWWRKFLLSQAIAMKIPVDKVLGPERILSTDGTGTAHVNLEQEQERRVQLRPIQV